jgi:photosystem II stability/assembly factor-like uncharacterized protein
MSLLESRLMTKRVSLIISIVFVILQASIPAIGQDQWTWRNPLPTGNSLKAIAGNAATMAVVGEAGTIVTSPDGSVWTIRNTGLNVSFYDIISTENGFIAVGQSNMILLSTDNGASWNIIDGLGGLPNEAHVVLFSIARNGNQCVAVGDNGTITTSSDKGLHWVQCASPTTKALRSIVWTGNRYIAVGEAGTVVSSVDGTVWTLQSVAGGSDVSLNSISASGPVLAIAGTDGIKGVIYTSTDGSQWTSRPSGVTTSLFRIYWTGNIFVATGEYGTIITSPDGVTWTQQVCATTYDLQGVYKSQTGTFVVGYGGIILSSNDGTVWVKKSSDIANQNFLGVVWTGKELIAIDGNGVVETSKDGTTWSVRDSGAPPALKKILWTGNQLVAIGSSGTIAVSTDGSGWTMKNSNTSTALYGITSNDTCFVAVGEGGTVVTSSDGENWTLRNSTVTNTLTGVTWTGKEFIAVGSGSTMIASEDGVSWSPRAIQTLTNDALSGIVSNGTTIVVIGSASGVYTSTDGIKWTRQYWDFWGGALNDIVWTGSRFVAVGMAGTILASKADSQTVFTIIYSGCQKDLYGITNTSGNGLVAVGTEGAILTSATVGIKNQERKVNNRALCHPETVVASSGNCIVLPRNMSAKNVPVSLFDIQGRQIGRVHPGGSRAIVRHGIAQGIVIAKVR